MNVRQPTLILVYSGRGSTKESRKLLYNALISAVDQKQHVIQYIMPRQILQGSWMKSTCLIVFGGGYDRGFESALDREGVKQIRTFVENGGSYLGICAGAYWACDRIQFDKGGPLEVTGERFLKFYPGLCIGPAFPGFAYKSRVGVHAVSIKYKEVTDFDAYSEGGGFFKPYSQVEGTSIINQQRAVTSVQSECSPPRIHEHTSEVLPPNIQAHDTFHKNLPPPTVETLGIYTTLGKDTSAIVKCRVGKGLAVLSGVHLEFSAHLLNKRDIYIQPLLPIFVRSEDSRVHVFRDILIELGVKVGHSVRY